MEKGSLELYCTKAAVLCFALGMGQFLDLYCQIILFISLTAAFFTGLEMGLFISCLRCPKSIWE